MDNSTRDSNLVENGSFWDGLEGWAGKKVRLGEVQDLPCARFTTTRATWLTQTSPHKVKAGKRYVLSFAACAKTEQDILVQLGASVSAGNTEQAFTAFANQVTASWKSHTAVFTVPQYLDHGRLSFQILVLGREWFHPGSVFVTEVLLYELAED